MLVCAVCVTPVALVTQVSGIWTTVWPVARQSGYPNINTFFIAFRNAEDTIPAAFRKNRAARALRLS
jgi:hypothetical protein